MTRTYKHKREWYTKEHKLVRKRQRKSYRLLNKTRIKSGNWEYEEAPRTQGWITW